VILANKNIFITQMGLVNLGNFGRFSKNISGRTAGSRRQTLEQLKLCKSCCCRKQLVTA
jgi:hypothetical protein